MPGGGRFIISTTNPELEEPSAGEGDVALSGLYVIIQVADTGLGMPPEIANHAFEPILHSKDRGEGTGLGLSMVCGLRGSPAEEAGRWTIPTLYLACAWDGNRSAGHGSAFALARSGRNDPGR
jgi:Histidine kinase-, DNA gyrase B-, and HSP90-like ATPase